MGRQELEDKRDQAFAALQGLPKVATARSASQSRAYAVAMNEMMDANIALAELGRSEAK